MYEGLKAWLLALSVMVRELPIYTAGPLMILVGALDSSLLSLPEVNDYITVWRVAHHPHEVYFFPLFPAVGSVMGCLVLYRVARGGEEFIERRFHPRHLQWAKDLYRKWGLFALVIPALLPPPMPFKVFVATAGALGYPMGRFAAVIMIARTIRYYAWGIAAFFMRDRVMHWLEFLQEHAVFMVGMALVALIAVFATSSYQKAMRSRELKGKAEASYTD